MTAARRPLMIVIALLAIGAAALLWSSSLVWAVERVDREAPLPSVAYSVTGSVAVPMVVALGVVALAAILAFLATGPTGRRIVGMAVLAVAVWTGVQLYEWTTAAASESSATMVAEGTKHSLDSVPEVSSFAGTAAIVGIFATAAAGMAIILLARSFARMGRKYERPGAESGKAAKQDDDGSARDRDLWNSLDRGVDPTA